MSIFSSKSSPLVQWLITKLLLLSFPLRTEGWQLQGTWIVAMAHQQVYPIHHPLQHLHGFLVCLSKHADRVDLQDSHPHWQSPVLLWRTTRNNLKPMTSTQSKKGPTQAHSYNTEVTTSGLWSSWVANKMNFMSENHPLHIVNLNH